MAGSVALTMDILARDKASKTLSDVGGNADKTGKKFAGLGNAAKAGMAIGVAALGAFAKSAVTAASDVAESQSKVNTVFGDSAGKIDAFAATAATSLGQSKGAVLDAAGTFGNLFTALGLTQSAAADMSTSAVTLATDLGSFNNASAPEALEAIKAGLLGEAEPLKRFGVNLSAARIEAEAFALGLAKPVKNAAAITAANNKVTVAVQKLATAQKEHGKGSIEAKTAQDAVARAQADLTKAMQGSTPELTAAQKAQAAYSVILKDTKTAQGDFARTSDGMANQTKIAKARFEDLQGTVGAKLLPVVNKAITAGLKMADWLERNRKIVVPLAIGIGGLGAAIYLIVTAVKVWTAVQKAFNVVMAMNPIGLAVIAIAALVAGVVIAYKKVGWFRDGINGLWGKIKETFGWVKANWPLLLGILTGPFGLAVVAIVKYRDQIWNAFKNLPGLIKKALVGLAEIVLAPLRAAWQGAINTYNATVAKLPGVDAITSTGTKVQTRVGSTSGTTSSTPVPGAGRVGEADLRVSTATRTSLRAPIVQVSINAPVYGAGGVQQLVKEITAPVAAEMRAMQRRGGSGPIPRY